MSAAAAFRAGLLDPAAPVPPGLTDGAGRHAARRYAVYRNNVTASLVEALRAGFPSVRAGLGPRAFDARALAFARAHPPRSPVLARYGDGFPSWLATCAPGWAGDLARLDLALRESYHAADHVAADASVLATADGPTLMGARLTPAPSLRLLTSRWSLLALRDAALGGGGVPMAAAEDGPPAEIAVLRHGWDPEPHLLPEGGAATLAALRAGRSLGEAATWLRDPDAFGDLLSTLLSAGALAAIEL